MKTSFKLDTEVVLTIERPCIDIPSSILITIKLALAENMLEDLEVGALASALIKETWRNEIKGIERELTLRN
jgi:hypothetical protein